jgi:murein endopeptidase
MPKFASPEERQLTYGRRVPESPELRHAGRRRKNVRYRLWNRTALVVLVIAAAVSGCHGPLTMDDGAELGMSGPPSRAVANAEESSHQRLRTPNARPRKRIQWRRSKAVGTPWAGRLVNGVRLPPEGRLFFTWDPVKDRSPNRAYRRYGTDRLLRVILDVLRAYSAAHPKAPRVGIGDLSRRNGGNFGKRFGGLGHSSHQNGRDVDIYYPRRDRREREPRTPAQIDRALAQDLVHRFVRAGAQYVFVGPHTRLRGPHGVVQQLVHHDNHMHVRIQGGR